MEPRGLKQTAKDCLVFWSLDRFSLALLSRSYLSPQPDTVVCGFPTGDRVTATALASLANPFGGAVSIMSLRRLTQQIGQLVGPFILSSPNKTPQLVIYVSIIVSIHKSLD